MNLRASKVLNLLCANVHEDSDHNGDTLSDTESITYPYNGQPNHQSILSSSLLDSESDSDSGSDGDEEAVPEEESVMEVAPIESDGDEEAVPEEK